MKHIFKGFIMLQTRFAKMLFHTAKKSMTDPMHDTNILEETMRMDKREYRETTSSVQRDLSVRTIL